MIQNQKYPPCLQKHWIHQNDILLLNSDIVKSIRLIYGTLNTSQDDISLLNYDASRNIHSMPVMLSTSQDNILLLNVGEDQKTLLTQDQQNLFEK